MNRHKVLLVLLMVSFMGAIAQAQEVPQTPQAPQQRGGGPATPLAGGDVLNLLGVLGVLQQPAGQQLAGQRGAGGRRGAPANLPVLGTTNTNGPLVANRVLTLQGGGAWWTNTALLTRLGLTDDQKLRIERAYENHRQNLVSSKDLLEKEEAQLAKLLEADPLDRTTIVAQIYKVIQARGEMEKTNSLMTFEMREVLTRAQWMQLQAAQPPSLSDYLLNHIAPAAGTPGQRGPGGGGRGARGQQ